MAGGIYVRQTRDSAVLKDEMYYVHADHLGSLAIITDSKGDVKQQCTFDAWGRRTFVVRDSSLVFDRGYTGHEHLDEFGLINMNGRMYEPLLGRFLSPDPYVPDMAYSQDFNRYSYARNNPLIYIDPTGEKWWHWLLGAAIFDPISTTATIAAIATTGSTLYANAVATATAASNTLSAVDFTVTFFGTMFKNDPSWGGKRLGNWAKLELQHINSLTGTFKYDKSADAGEWVLQVLNNLGSGEILQDFAGNTLGHQQNIAGNVDKMGYYDGRLITRLKNNSIPGAAISLGHYIIGEGIALNPNDTGHDLDLFTHEYGHTYQSRITGPLYLFRYGLSSIINNDGVSEADATRRGSSNLGITIKDTTRFPSGSSTYKWYEFGFAPVLWSFMWSWNIK